MKQETIIETEIDKLVKEATTNSKQLILYNDDVNSFADVIECLVLYCKHTYIQAEQCANIVHHNGKVGIKNGDFDQLLPIYTALLDNKLNVKIE